MVTVIIWRNIFFLVSTFLILIMLSPRRLWHLIYLDHQLVHWKKDSVTYNAKIEIISGFVSM